MLLLFELFSKASAMTSFLALIFCAAGTAPSSVQPAILGKLVDVGGYRVHLYCTGAGSPTVMVAGMVFVDHAFIDVSGDFHRDSSEDPLAAFHLDQPPVLISKTPIVLTLEDDQNFRKLPQRNQELHLWAMSAHRFVQQPRQQPSVLLRPTSRRSSVLTLSAKYLS